MGTSDCLDPNTVVSLMEGKLEPGEARRVEQHVKQCSDCFQLMVDLGRAGSVAAESATPEPRAEPDRVENGDVIGHFEVDRLIGRGGMGEVYLAHDRTLGRRVALKLIHPRLMTSREAVARFRNEARVTAQLNHPNVVTIHAVGEHGDRPWVALEYVEGRTLRQELDLGRPSPSRALTIASELGEAVAAAHARRIWHRDLKPENVLIDGSGRVRVVDFGLAKLAAELPPSLRHPAGPALAPSTFAGTPLYMAPEQWRQAELSAAVDVWAFGAIVYELYAGRHPFESLGPSALRDAVTGERPAPPLESAPTEIAALVARCLAKLPEARPDAAEIVSCLRALSAPKKSRSGLAWTIAALAMLVSIATVAFVSLRSAPRAVALQPAPLMESPSLRTLPASSSGAATNPAPAPTLVTRAQPQAPRSSATQANLIPIPPPVPTPSSTAAAPAPYDYCRDEPECAASGQCKSRGGLCVAVSDADCARSGNCKKFGNCARIGDRCLPASGDHCRASSQCRSWGTCALQGNRCAPGSDADCRASTDCKTKGLCSLKDGWCQ